MFKVEWEGEGFIGLAAKTYYCFTNDQKKDKVSTKGINKSANISKQDFLSVKDTKASVSAVNRGFLFKDNKMFTCEMERKGLSYFYCKRKVLDDGVSTTFLDI